MPLYHSVLHTRLRSPLLQGAPHREPSPVRADCQRTTSRALNSVHRDDQAAANHINLLSRRAALTVPAALVALSSGSPAKAATALFCDTLRSVPSWAFTTPWEQRLVEFHGYKTWTRAVGRDPNSRGPFGFLKGGKSQASAHQPVLVLHGGPGLGSEYLSPLELLASPDADRRVVFYDQIGCGNSYLASGNEAPPESEYSLSLFEAELSAVLAALKLEHYHVVGHGWGGILALQALLDGGLKGAASLTLMSTAASYRQLVDDRLKRVRQLPSELEASLLEGAPGQPAYDAAFREYQRRFVARLRPDNPCMAAAGSPAVRQAMCGGSVFKAAGALENWSVADRLAEMAVPALVVRGEFDETSAESAQQLQQGLPQAQLLTLPGAGSYVQIDQFDPLLQRMEAFFQQAEGSSGV